MRLHKVEAFDGAGATIFFLARLIGTDARKPSLRALCASGPGGVARVLVRVGSVVDDRTVDSLETLIGATGSHAEGRWRDGPDAFGVALTFDDRTQAISTIAVSADSAEEWRHWNRGLSTPRGTRRSLGLPGFAAGSTAFSRKILMPDATPAPGTLATTSRVQLLSLHADPQTANQTPSLVPDASGHPIPGLRFKTFAAPVQGAAGRTAFEAVVDGEAVSKANESGIWYGAGDGTLTLVARTGDAALGGGVWEKFESLVLPDGPESRPIFTARVSSGHRKVRGLWAVGSSGVLHLLLRTGLPMAAGGMERVVRSFVALEAGSGPGGVARGYDDDQHVMAVVVFQDGIQALLSITIP